MELLPAAAVAALYLAWRVFERFPDAASKWLDLLDQWKHRQARKQRKSMRET